MKASLLSLAAAGALLVSSGLAVAAEPVTLAPHQLDGVTAGQPTLDPVSQLVTAIIKNGGFKLNTSFEVGSLGLGSNVGLGTSAVQLVVVGNQPNLTLTTFLITPYLPNFNPI